MYAVIVFLVLLKCIVFRFVIIESFFNFPDVHMMVEDPDKVSLESCEIVLLWNGFLIAWFY